MRVLRLALSLAFGLFLAIPLSAQTARDSVAVSRIQPDLTALLLHDRQLCQTKSAPAYKCKTAPVDTMRERHVLAVLDSLLRPPTVVPPPTPLPPNPTPAPALTLPASVGGRLPPSIAAGCCGAVVSVLSAGGATTPSETGSPPSGA